MSDRPDIHDRRVDRAVDLLRDIKVYGGWPRQVEASIAEIIRVLLGLKDETL